MVSQLDRWRAAQQLIKSNGDQAEYQAGVRAGDLLKQGSQEGFELWQDIAKKVVQLRNQAATSRTN